MIVKRVFIAAYGRLGILSTMYRERDLVAAAAADSTTMAWLMQWFVVCVSL